MAKLTELMPLKTWHHLPLETKIWGICFSSIKQLNLDFGHPASTTVRKENISSSMQHSVTVAPGN
jgi:hypothetical protein